MLRHGESQYCWSFNVRDSCRDVIGREGAVTLGILAPEVLRFWAGLKAFPGLLCLNQGRQKSRRLQRRKLGIWLRASNVGSGWLAR